MSPKQIQVPFTEPGHVAGEGGSGDLFVAPVALRSRGDGHAAGQVLHLGIARHSVERDLVHLLLPPGAGEKSVVHPAIGGEQDETGAVLIEPADGEESLGEEVEAPCRDDVARVLRVAGAGDPLRLPVLEVDKASLLQHGRRRLLSGSGDALPPLQPTVQPHLVPRPNPRPAAGDLPVDRDSARRDRDVGASPREGGQTLVQADSLGRPRTRLEAGHAPASGWRQSEARQEGQDEKKSEELEQGHPCVSSLEEGALWRAIDCYVLGARA